MGQEARPLCTRKRTWRTCNAWCCRGLQLRRLPALRRDRALRSDHENVVRFAGDGGLVLGICNGFQILCEAHLLPGALMRNRSLAFICERVNLRVENAATPFTCAARQGEVLRLPIKHGEGLYVAPAEELRAMEERGQVLLRYTDAAGHQRDDEIRTARPGRSPALPTRPSTSSA